MMNRNSGLLREGLVKDWFFRFVCFSFSFFLRILDKKIVGRLMLSMFGK